MMQNIKVRRLPPCPYYYYYPLDFQLSPTSLIAYRRPASSVAMATAVVWQGALRVWLCGLDEATG